MLNQIFALTVKEIKVLLRNRGALTALFLLPVAFILVMTFALQGVFDSGSSKNPVRLLVANQDSGTVAAKVVADLKKIDGLILTETVDGVPITRESAEQLITDPEIPAGVGLPRGFFGPRARRGRWKCCGSRYG